MIITSFMARAQVEHIKALNAPDSISNIYNKKLFGDSLASSFIIIIKKEVKLHRHDTHSEHIYVVSGKAQMTLGNESFDMKPGDFIFIPKGTPHKVKVISVEPFKVLSIQAPLFDGKDRVMLE